MCKNKLFKYFALQIFMCFSLVSTAQNFDFTLNVQKAGTLSTYINVTKKYQISNLTLTGYINNEDVLFLEDMTKNGILSRIDLSNSNYYSTTFNASLLRNCSRLNEVKLPNNIKIISDYVLNNCDGLKSFSISDSVVTIGKWVIQGCDSITEVKFGKSTTSIGESSFAGCNTLRYIKSAENLKTIGNSAFSGCKKLDTIPNLSSLITLGQYSFNNCDSLRYISLGEKVLTIGEGAFSGRNRLNEIFIAENNPNYSTDGSAILNKQKTILLTFPVKVSSYTLPNSVTQISSKAFYQNTTLTNMEFGNQLMVIADEAFKFCSGLKKIELPESLVVLGKNCFYECKELNSVTIGKNDTIIGDFAFFGCTSLNSIVIPENTKIIGNSAFSASGIISIIFNDKLESIGNYAFYGCSKLISVVLPKSIKSIGDFAFQECLELKNATIENTMAYSMFQGCTKLYSITFNSNELTSKNYPFNLCTSLREIHSRATIPPIITDKFFYSLNKSNLKLFVPKGAASNYWLAPYWGDITSLQEEDSTLSTYYIVRTSQSEGGVVKVNNVDVSNSSYKQGESISFKFECTKEYKLSKVLINGIDKTSSVINNTYFVASISSNIDLKVLFEKKKTYAIALNCSEGGSASLNGAIMKYGDKVIVIEGDTAKLIVNKNASYKISSFVILDSIKSISETNTVLILPTRDQTIQLLFSKLINVVPTSNTNGKISINGQYASNFLIDPEKDVVVDFTPNDGMKLKRVYYNGINITSGIKDNRINLKQPERDIKIEAIFDEPIFLTIKQTNYNLIQEVKDSSNYSFDFSIQEGWKINTLMFNDEDVSSQISLNNNYTTPIITKNSTLTVSIELISSTTNTSENSNVKIWGNNDNVSILGAKAGELIEVYSTSGVLIKSIHSSTYSTSIQLPKDKVYLIKIADKSYKVAI